MRQADRMPVAIIVHKRIVDGLKRITHKIERYQTFSKGDLVFINSLLSNELDRNTCAPVLSRLYLHLKYGKIGSLNQQEYGILESLSPHKEALGIPPIQPVFSDDR